jgi:hypothetical protein
MMAGQKFRRPQHMGYLAGAILGVLCLLLFVWPGQESLRARGPMNAGHEKLRCAACHRPAPGSLRQELQANARYLLGLRRTVADFGYRDVTNETCLRCHERRNDRHPVYRFFEPRFKKAREAIRPQFCTTCHLEHTGRRVTAQSIGYCVNCHEKTRLKNDPISIPHERLIADKRWESCLGCHDFHGNHVMKTKTAVDKAFPSDAIRFYFAGGRSPYPEEKHQKAKEEPDDE